MKYLLIIAIFLYLPHLMCEEAKITSEKTSFPIFQREIYNIKEQYKCEAIYKQQYELMYTILLLEKMEETTLTNEQILNQSSLDYIKSKALSRDPDSANDTSYFSEILCVQNNYAYVLKHSLSKRLGDDSGIGLVSVFKYQFDSDKKDQVPKLNLRKQHGSSIWYQLGSPIETMMFLNVELAYGIKMGDVGGE